MHAIDVETIIDHWSPSARTLLPAACFAVLANFWTVNSYGQAVVNRTVAVDLDRPAKIQISPLVNFRRGNRPSTMAGFHDVWIVFVRPDASTAPDTNAAAIVDDGSAEVRGAVRTPEIRFLGGTVDEFIFGKASKPNRFEAVNDSLNRRLREEIEAVQAACNLTPIQRRRLTLAGQGDIQRFLDRAEKLKVSFDRSGDLRTDEQFCRWVEPLGTEAEQLGRLLDSSLFDPASLFSKVLTTTLSPDQLARLAAMPPIGTGAPEFPDDGWIGGPRSELKGKPYLIYFWATQSSVCKVHLPALNELAGKGANIIGIHPVPSPREHIERFIRDEKLSFPTLSGAHDLVGPFLNIEGCRVKVLPYGIVVDRHGLVAAFGMVGPLLLEKFRELRESGKSS